jgi:hypothetical protein
MISARNPVIISQKDEKCEAIIDIVSRYLGSEEMKPDFSILSHQLHQCNSKKESSLPAGLENIPRCVLVIAPG